MDLYLIRHGQSIGNISGNVYGKTDYPLTEKGIRQAELACKYFEELEVDYVYSSPLVRARVIGEAIAEDHKLEVFIDDRLTEMDFGIYEDVAIEEIRKIKNRDEYIDIISPFSNAYIEAGDNHNDFRERIKSFINSLIQEIGDTDKKVVCTCHQGIIRVAMQHLLEFEPKQVMHYKSNPGCIIHFQIKNGYGKLVGIIQEN